MHKTAHVLLIRSLLVILAVFNIGRYVYKLSTEVTMDDPMDFRANYVATKLANQNRYFYNDSLLKDEWSKIVSEEQIKSEIPPGFPTTGVIYPPWFPLAFKPFTAMSWEKARLFIQLLNPVLLLLIAWFLSRMYKNAWLWLIVPIFAFKGTIYALYIAQPMILSLFFVALSLYLYKVKNKKIPSGIFLGLASFKLSLVVPFVLFFMIRWEWKLLFVSLGVLLAQAAIIMLPYQDPIGLANGFIDNLNRIWELGIATEINAHNINNTELSTAVAYFFNAGKTTLSIISYGGLILSFFIIWFISTRRSLSDSILLVLLCTASLVFTHHYIYDGLILIFMVPAIAQLKPWQAKWIMLLLVALMLPITGMALKLSDGVLKDLLIFHAPILMFILLISLVIFATGYKKPYGSYS